MEKYIKPMMRVCETETELVICDSGFSMNGSEMGSSTEDFSKGRNGWEEDEPEF